MEPSTVRLGLAVAHIPRAKRVAEGDALAGVLARVPMGCEHPQGYAPNEMHLRRSRQVARGQWPSPEGGASGCVSRNAGASGLRLLD